MQLAWKIRVGVLCLVVALLAASTTSLLSQSAPTRSLTAADSTNARAADRAACIDALPANQLRESVVYLHAEISDSINASSLVPQADLLASEVAIDLRTRLGGSNSVIPSVDTIAKPSSLPARLVVTFRPDGGAMRKLETQYGDTPTAELLVASFDAIRKNGDGAMVWPDGYHADSIVVALELWPETIVRDRSVPHYVAHSEFAAFSSLVPITRAAVARDGNPNPRYPIQNESRRVSGYLMLQFEVDTAGHAVDGTVHDIWPANKPRLTGQMGMFYDGFVEATKDALKSWKFYPAYVGTCPVRQIVQLPIEYKVH